MHACDVCGLYCACDGEDTVLDQPEDCSHECESDEPRCPTCTPDGVATDECHARAAMQAELDAICALPDFTIGMPGHDDLEGTLAILSVAMSEPMTVLVSQDTARRADFWIRTLRERLKIRDEDLARKTKESAHYMGHMFDGTVCACPIDEIWA